MAHFWCPSTEPDLGLVAFLARARGGPRGGGGKELPGSPSPLPQPVSNDIHGDGREGAKERGRLGEAM